MGQQEFDRQNNPIRTASTLFPNQECPQQVSLTEYSIGSTRLPDTYSSDDNFYSLGGVQLPDTISLDDNFYSLGGVQLPDSYSVGRPPAPDVTQGNQGPGVESPFISRLSSPDINAAVSRIANLARAMPSQPCS